MVSGASRIRLVLGRCSICKKKKLAKKPQLCSSLDELRAGSVGIHWLIALLLKGLGARRPPAARLMLCKKSQCSKQSLSVATRREGQLVARHSPFALLGILCSGEYLHGGARLDRRATNLPSRPLMNVHKPWHSGRRQSLAVRP